MGVAKPDEKSIFNAARRIAAPEARRQYLARACGDDSDLCARVEALLRVFEEDSTFLGSPAIELPADFTDLIGEAPGSVVGPYTLVRQIGEGGMGVVFLAEQAQPVRRQVALKVVRPGMDSRQVLTRFEAERQALARMDHPNIAKVLDAGITPAGRPYFVMELVPGPPITRYCDEHRLTVRQRLELFVQVCQGVQHAHRKGIIHRDLKPTNVLVPLYDGKPVPKIIDFGLAKATGQKLTDSTLVTQLGLVLGTPEYMSPEQAEPTQLDIDTRSDVYSLGVLLYQLLTGTTPLRREADTDLLGLLRAIREDEPPRPSTRLGTSPELPTLAADRGAEPRSLVAQVRGDLDWIAVRCLEKDRTRRYETADALARDVGRHLRHEPVEASPPSAGYRLRKFARRHRAVLATAAAFVLLLLGGVAVSAWQAVRATAAEKKAVAERDQKEEARRQARRAINELTDEMVERWMTRQARLTEPDRAYLRRVLALHEEFARDQGDDPETRVGVAEARFRVGVIRRRLGENKEAEEAYRAAIAIRQKLADDFPDQPDYRRDLARTHTNLGNLLQDVGRSGPAEEAHRTAIAILQKVADDFPDQPDCRSDLATAHNNLGLVLMATNRAEQAEQAWRTAVDVMRKLVADSARPEYRSLLASSYQNLGNLLFSTNRLREAEECMRAGLDLFRKLADEFPGPPEYRRDLGKSHNNLGILLDATGRPKDAEEAFRADIAIKQKLAAEFPTQPEYAHLLAQSHHTLGEFLRDGGPSPRAEEAYLAARAILARLAADFPDVPDYRTHLAGTLGRLALLKSLGRGDNAAASRLLEEARPHHQAALRANPKHPEYREGYRVHLATAVGVLLSLGDHQKAAATADELIQLAQNPAEDAYAAARTNSLCSSIAGKDVRLTEAERERTRAYADRAVDLLRGAVRHGFKNGDRVRKDRAFLPVHARDDFRTLLRELDAASGRS